MLTNGFLSYCEDDNINNEDDFSFMFLKQKVNQLQYCKRSILVFLISESQKTVEYEDDSKVIIKCI